ncbi:MAG TPA: hypothetical protein VLG49_04815 [Rhabdochlamydiaceae bacterium]|nr:hypothetical protein [Rhabdochlamydiaceae bacterium]
MYLIVILFLVCFTSAHGSYNGNPAFPKIPEEGLYVSKESYCGIKTGYIGDYVFDRNMVLHASGLHGEVDRFQILNNLGVLSFSYLERVEAYARLGCMHANIAHRPISDLRVRYKIKGQFAWCFGVEGIIYEHKNTIVSVNVNYFQSLPKIHAITAGGIAVEPHGAEINYLEWQGSVGVSQAIGLFLPYIGVEYSNARAMFKKMQALNSFFPESEFTMRSEHKIGIFLGCSITPGKTAILNVEARFVDETALTLSGLIRF